MPNENSKQQLIIQDQHQSAHQHQSAQFPKHHKN